MCDKEVIRGKKLDVFATLKKSDAGKGGRRCRKRESRMSRRLGRTANADDALSPREVEVLKLIASGNTNKMIAAQLAVTEETVKGHVKNILWMTARPLAGPVERSSHRRARHDNDCDMGAT
jgi:DNA-binding CsgD family transcriptional regulator